MKSTPQLSRAAPPLVGPTLPCQTVIMRLKEGDFFGELALLFSQPRNASVRAVDYCDLYTLDKETFDHVLARYPEFTAYIKEEADRRHPQTMQERGDEERTERRQDRRQGVSL